jgi:arylsulfatase A-like enzyme
MPSSTGLYGNRHWWKPNFPTIVTLPGHFRMSGYRVVGSGKIFHHTAGGNPPDQWDAYFPLLFQESAWFRANRQNYPWTTYVKPPSGFPFSGVEGLGDEFDWGPLPIGDSEYDDVLSVDYAVRFLREPQPNPFFLACGLLRPHLPWYVPQHFFNLYPEEAVMLPPVRDDDLDDVPKAGREISAFLREDFERVKAAGAWRRAVRAYLASISFADAEVGRLLDALEASGQAGNTFIVFWSDHGWHLGEKNHWHKSTLWEEATRVPFIIAGPGLRAGQTCVRPVGLIDIFPTLIKLCGLTTVSGLDGHDLGPLLRNPGAAWDRPAVIEYERGNAAVRSEQFRYIRYHDASEELYDHRTDPHEWANLASDPHYAGIKQELQKWIATTWAESAPGREAFDFSPGDYSWTNRKTGAKVLGREPGNSPKQD